MLARFMQYQTRPTHFASSRCALSGKRSAVFRAALVLVCDNEPPKARMAGTLILWYVAGGVARAQASGSAHVGDRPLVVHIGG
jgi:hypothetical protein